MKGWIYILTNDGFRDLLKIGFSDRDPVNRVEELYTTGVPFPFKLVYSALAADAAYVEKLVHTSLNEYRVNESREFFRITTRLAIERIRNTCQESGVEIISEEICESFEEIGKFQEQFLSALDSIVFEIEESLHEKARVLIRKRIERNGMIDDLRIKDFRAQLEKRINDIKMIIRKAVPELKNEFCAAFDYAVPTLLLKNMLSVYIEDGHLDVYLRKRIEGKSLFLADLAVGL